MAEKADAEGREGPLSHQGRAGSSPAPGTKLATAEEGRGRPETVALFILAARDTTKVDPIVALQ